VLQQMLVCLVDCLNAKLLVALQHDRGIGDRLKLFVDAEDGSLVVR
jgi:hypothetical protein